jgi:hypothetical protein
MTIAGISASTEFSTLNTCTTINPGLTCSVPVTFTPTSAGPKTGELTINVFRSWKPAHVAVVRDWSGGRPLTKFFEFW